MTDNVALVPMRAGRPNAAAHALANRPPALVSAGKPASAVRTLDNAGKSQECTIAESTIAAKGQTTVPVEIRALVHATPGRRRVWSALPDGAIIVRAKSRSLLDRAGMLEAPKGSHVSDEDMKRFTAQATVCVAARTRRTMKTVLAARQQQMQTAVPEQIA